MAAHLYWSVLVDKTTTATQSVSCSKLEMYATRGGANLCTGGTAFASSRYSSAYTAAKAFDGIDASMWVSSGSATTWRIGYHFASPVDVAAMLYRSQGDGYAEQNPAHAIVEWSDDATYDANGVLTGGTWTRDWTWVPDAAWTAGASLLRCRPTPEEIAAPHDKWKIALWAPSAALTNYALAEVEIFARTGATTDETGPDQTTAANDGKASASSVYNPGSGTAQYAAWKAVDDSLVWTGDDTHKWTSSGVGIPQWWAYDFGTPKYAAQWDISAIDDGTFCHQNPGAFDLLFYDATYGWIAIQSYSGLTWTAAQKRTFLGGGAFPPATMIGVTPDHGPTAGGTVVTITGSGFSSATGVTFGGDAATDVVVVSDTEITCTTPPHAAGAVDVTVQIPTGDVTLTGGFTYEEPAAAPPPTTRFILEHLVMPTVGDASLGTVILYDGLMGKVTQKPNATTIEILSHAEVALSREIPTRIQEPNCGWIFKGTECGYLGGDTTCAHTRDACFAKSNLARFSGNPNLPPVSSTT